MRLLSLSSFSRACRIGVPVLALICALPMLAQQKGKKSETAGKKGDVAKNTKGSAAGEKSEKAKVPEDLQGNEHVREEFGVNEFTTPSIRKIFDALDALGTLPYDQLKRPINDKAPSDRVLIALGLGTLIGDGFLVVQCEKIEEMENVGHALLKYAKALGAGVRINKHSQSLLENSLKGDWDKLRAELASTQADVE